MSVHSGVNADIPHNNGGLRFLQLNKFVIWGLSSPVKVPKYTDTLYLLEFTESIGFELPMCLVSQLK